jgi:uncharacterized phiE125 gp8 family phage protein
MALKTITPPTAEPVTVQEAKLHLRVDSNEEEAYIASLIQTAREHIETAILHRSLVTRTLEYVISRFPCGAGSIQLPMPPLLTITSVIYTDSVNVEHTITAAAYCVNADASPGIILPAYGTAWPADTLAPSGAVHIRYTAGYGLPAVVPQSFKSAIKLLVGHLYANRELMVSTNLQNMPLAIDSLCADRCYMKTED